MTPTAPGADPGSVKWIDHGLVTVSKSVTFASKGDRLESCELVTELIVEAVDCPPKTNRTHSIRARPVVNYQPANRPITS